METVRIYCDAPEYADAWIDVAAVWSQRQLQRLLEVAGDDFYAFLRERVGACHIPTLEGEPITDVAQLSDDGLGDVDVLLLTWIGAVMPLAVARRRALGNASARLSLPSNGATTARTTVAPT
jgi:hypothetical protein